MGHKMDTTERRAHNQKALNTPNHDFIIEDIRDLLAFGHQNMARAQWGIVLAHPSAVKAIKDAGVNDLISLYCISNAPMVCEHILSSPQKLSTFSDKSQVLLKVMNELNKNPYYIIDEQTYKSINNYTEVELCYSFKIILCIKTLFSLIMNHSINSTPPKEPLFFDDLLKGLNPYGPVALALYQGLRSRFLDLSLDSYSLRPRGRLTNVLMLLGPKCWGGLIKAFEISNGEFDFKWLQPPNGCESAAVKTILTNYDANKPRYRKVTEAITGTPCRSPIMTALAQEQIRLATYEKRILVSADIGELTKNIRDQQTAAEHVTQQLASYLEGKSRTLRISTSTAMRALFEGAPDEPPAVRQRPV
jgi:hypothetical protein